MTPSLVALVIANALPLVGVLFLGWTVFPLVLLYWLENLVVGGFNVTKLLLTQPRQPAYWLGKAFLVPFFLVHFGGFTYIHGVLVVAFFGPKTAPAHRRSRRDPSESAGLGCVEPRAQPRLFLLLELPEERRIPARLAERPDGAALRSRDGAAYDRAFRGVGRHAAGIAALRAGGVGGIEDRGRLARAPGRAAQVWTV